MVYLGHRGRRPLRSNSCRRVTHNRPIESGPSPSVTSIYITIMIVSLTPADDRYRLLITVKETDQQDVIFHKDIKEVIDFLDMIWPQLNRCGLRPPRNLSSLEHAELGELLTKVVNHAQINQLLKVRGFFVNVGKQRIKFSKTIQPFKPGRSTLNSTNASSKKPSETFSNGILQLENTKLLEKSSIDITNPQLVSYLEGLHYTEIAGLGNGASKAVFKAKNSKGEFVAVKVGKLQEEYKMRMEKKITSSVGQKMSRALFGGFLEIYQVFSDPSNNFIVIEEELASKTLRDIILEKRQKGEFFSKKQLTKVIQDLVECLYHMHVQNQVVHRDIKPHNIFYTQHRYTFGDYGQAEQKNVNILDRRIKTKMCQLKGTPMYMETKLLSLCNRTQLDVQLLSTTAKLRQSHIIRLKEMFFEYDPFKADVYSLGLVFFELVLHNAGYVLDDQIQTLFYWQRGEKMFDDLVKSFDLRSKEEKYILMRERLLEVPSLLQRMLDENQTTRISTFELSLLSTHKSTILSNILTPFTDIFLPKVYSQPENQYQVEYNYKSMVYRGQYAHQKREGFGTMYRRAQFSNVIPEQDEEQESSNENEQSQNSQGSINEKSSSAMNPMSLEGMTVLYQGHWKMDLPHKKGTLRLNDSDNKYVGEFLGGMFDGQGEVFFKDKPIYKANWKSNYNDHILHQVENFANGTHTFRAVCQESITIYGFIERLELPVRKFIMEIDNSMKDTIKAIFMEIIRVLGKIQIQKISQNRNYIHNYNEVILQAGQNSISFIFHASQQILTWLLDRILQNFSLGSLAILNLSKGQFTSQPVCSLAKRLDCFSLIEIDFESCCFIGSKSLNTLFKSSMVNSILKINIGGTQVSDSTMDVLANSTFLTRLREMSLRFCRFITQKGFMVWINSKNVKELELLDVSDTFLGHVVAKSFIGQNSLKKLRRLRIHNVPILKETIAILCKSKPMSGVTELYCGAQWIAYLQSLEKLRSIHFKGKQRVSKRAFVEFLQSWKHNRLQIASPVQFVESEVYESCRDAVKPLIEQQGHPKIVVSCYKNYIKINIDLVTDELIRVDLEKKKDLECLKQRLTTGKEKVIRIKELVIRNGMVGDGGDFLNKLVKCDFTGIEVQKVRINGYIEEDTKVGLQMSKHKILQLSEQIKQLISNIKPKVIIISEIFQRDSNIAALLRDKIADLPLLKINGILNTTGKIFTANIEPMPICKTFSDATLDQILHALAASECLMRLKKLSLKGHTNVTDRGLSYIINSRYCSNINDLDLSNTYISGNVFILLRVSDHLQLKTLNLNNIASINYEDLESYVFSQNSKQLKKLQLKNCNINKLDLFFLSLNLQNLEEIDIHFNGSIQPSVPHIDKLIKGAKYDKLHKVFLNFSKCKASPILKHIFKTLRPELKKIKLDLSSLQPTEDFTEKMISQEIFEVNLNKMRGKQLTLLHLNFNKTRIFENYFFEFLGSIMVKQLRLSFAERFENEHMAKLAYSMRTLFPLIQIFELNIDRCTNLNRPETSSSLAYILQNLTKVEVLYLNFAYCRQMLNWKNILQSLKSLVKVRILNMNLERCKLVDETDIICQWITTKLFPPSFEQLKAEQSVLIEQLSPQKQKPRVFLNLSNCWRLQGNDRCFFNILKMISDRTKFSPKMRLYLKKIKLPLEFKTKLIELSKRSEYELQFDQ